jgi:CPA1 family monovalent cation:H+ antiporter
MVEHSGHLPLLIGLVIGWPVAWLHRYLDDAPIEITITLLTPYAAYLVADALQVSGVLAVLSAGLYLSRQSSRFFSSNTRLQANAVWNVLVFLLNGLLFLLIGLQLRSILETIAGHSLFPLVWQALLISLAVIAVRIAWVFSATSLSRLISLRWRDPYPGWRQVAIIAWIGMRWGLSLAAALALPLSLTGGLPFPQRDLVIFFTFGVILVTLVGQGWSFGIYHRLDSRRRAALALGVLLLLLAFGCMILEIPVTILQLTGVLPSIFPLWYSLCRMGVTLIAVVIAVWMGQIYRHHGVWAMGKKKKARL